MFRVDLAEAGSDAAALIDSGVVCKGKWNGKTITGIKLNWDKRYITLAPVATVLGLAFKLSDPDRLIGDKEDYGITAALIPTDTAGVTIRPATRSTVDSISEWPDIGRRRIRTA